MRQWIDPIAFLLAVSLVGLLLAKTDQYRSPAGRDFRRFTEGEGFPRRIAAPAHEDLVKTPNSRSQHGAPQYSNVQGNNVRETDIGKNEFAKEVTAETAATLVSAF